MNRFKSEALRFDFEARDWVPLEEEVFRQRGPDKEQQAFGRISKKSFEAKATNRVSEELVPFREVP